MSNASLTESEAEAFRNRCRAFLQWYADRHTTNSLQDARDFLAAAQEAGLAGIPYGVEWGGAGLTSAHERIWREEKAAFAYFDRYFIISHGMCLPIINEFGTVSQRSAYESDMISGRKLWCQMFSEPGAGSDVAGLQMTAMRDGDEWVLNGQKVWTTYAHLSDYGIVIARTDASLPKHAGISMFIVDLRTPGVEVRPIHQMDGASEFNEVFFTDVRIPGDQVIGQVNDGWHMVTSMLMYERVAIGSGASDEVVHPHFDLLVDASRRAGTISHAIIRDELIQMYVLETCKSLVALRTRAEVKAGKTPGPGGSLAKLLGSTISRRFRDVAVEVAGPSAAAWPADDSSRREFETEILLSFRSGIAGGTDEIQRNIIGDRVLGLPREPAVDRDVPFRDLPAGLVS